MPDMRQTRGFDGAADVRDRSTSRAVDLLSLLGAAVGVFVAPWTGAWMANREPPGLFVLPPPERVVAGTTGFSWYTCGIVMVFIGTAALWVFFTWARLRRSADSDTHVTEALLRRHFPSGKRFPWWGFASATWTIAWWVAAWTRLDVLSPIQRYTFFPLWLGFIVTTNAVAEALTGGCLMRRATKRWLRLFALSGAFWWMFEWLNRFVENWHYLGVADLSATWYAVHATLSFSMVLPAVAAVAEVLGAIRWVRWWNAQALPGARLSTTRAAGLVALGYALLVATGAWPLQLYPSLWIAPLLILLGLRIADQKKRTTKPVTGEGAGVVSWMLAALICGFFWEMWNEYSCAKWFYTVPGVNRWHVFEMSLLGYSGYLPFGLECWLVAEIGSAGDAGRKIRS